MSTSSHYQEMVNEKLRKKINERREELEKDIENAQDKGESTVYLRRKAIEEYDKDAEKIKTTLADEDRALVKEYGKDAPRARSFMTKRADGGTITMPEDLGYMVGGAMKEKKRGPIKYAVGGAVKGKKFSGIF